MSNILIGSGCQSQNFPDKHVLKSGFYPVGVNKAGKAVIVSQVQVNLSQAFAASANGENCKSLQIHKLCRFWRNTTVTPQRKKKTAATDWKTAYKWWKEFLFYLFTFMKVIF